MSRVDTEIDKRLEGIATPAAQDLRGLAAVANARLAYALFRERFSGPRWEVLSGAGARVQRPLWASTGTKNANYSDVKYVDALIGPDTVNTFPPATLEAFRDHGAVARTVDFDVEGAGRAIEKIEALGISLDSVTDKLLKEGLAAFQQSFDSLLAGIEGKMGRIARKAASAR